MTKKVTILICIGTLLIACIITGVSISDLNVLAETTEEQSPIPVTTIIETTTAPVTEPPETTTEITTIPITEPPKTTIETTITTTTAETTTVLPPELRDKNRLPEGYTSIISGMPYICITNHKSQQWHLQMECETDELGARCYYYKNKKYYTAAMGSAYGRTIGDTFHVTLKNGYEFDVMLGEFKDDGLTDFFGHSKDQDGNPLIDYNGHEYTCVLEFIYDPEALDTTVLTYGTFSVIDCFGGIHSDGANIKNITYTGQKWKYKKN